MSDLNPLNTPGEIFSLALWNPNPKASKPKTGPMYRVSFEVDQETFLWFQEGPTAGMMLAAKCQVYLDIEAPWSTTKKTKGPHGEYYKRAVLMGTFYQVEVARALGTDEDFQKWTRLQPDHFTHEFSEYINGEGRCVFAHVADNSRQYGKQRKPEYSGLPMLQNEQHLIQHSYGWGALRDTYNPGETMDPMEWARAERDKHLHDWIAYRIQEIFAVESRTEIEPARMYQWAVDKGIEKYFPEP